MRSPKTFALIGYFGDAATVIIQNSGVGDGRILSYNLNEIVNRRRLVRLSRRGPKPLRVWLLGKIVGNCIKRHARDIVVLYYDHPLARALSGRTLGCPIHVVMQNVFDFTPSQLKAVRALQERGHTIWSFDRRDCARHGFKPYNQFTVRIPALENEPVARDFIFIGKNKGREWTLSRLAAVIHEQNLSAEIDIKYGKEDGLAAKDHDRHMPYLQYLQSVCRARCVIDVVKEGQHGMTARPLEAMFHRRKLVTNCAEVRDAPFYRPQNIIVFDDPRELADHDLGAFVSAPFVDVPQSDTRPFTLDALLDKIAAARNC